LKAAIGFEIIYRQTSPLIKNKENLSTSVVLFNVSLSFSILKKKTIVRNKDTKNLS